MGAFKRDTRGIRKILLSAEVARAIQGPAEDVAKHITAEHPDIEPGVHPGRTDRATVTIAVANGAQLQATEGLFTRAAASAGLEVKSR